jgi:DNA-binding LacI/PurR family transcriptional regulator
MSKPRKKPTSPARRMKDYRDRLRAAGLRPVQLWLYDTRTPQFAARARKAARLIAAHNAANREMDAFADAAFKDMGA